MSTHGSEQCTYLEAEMLATELCIKEFSFLQHNITVSVKATKRDSFLVQWVRLRHRWKEVFLLQKSAQTGIFKNRPEAVRKKRL